MRGRGCASEQALARFELDALSQLQRQGRELAELQHEQTDKSLRLHSASADLRRFSGISARSTCVLPTTTPSHGATACPGRVLGQAECCARGLSERTVVQLTRHTAALGVLRWHPLEKRCTWEHLGLDSARQALPSMSPGDRQGLEAEVAQAFRKPAMTDRFLTPAARLPRPPGGGHLTPCEQGLSKTTQQHTCWEAQATNVSLSGVWNGEAFSRFILPGHA